MINQEFDKLNILFSVILLKEYKLAFDMAVKKSINSFSCVPKSILEDIGTFVSELFPPMNSKLSETTVSFPDNLEELTKESVDKYVPSNNRKQVTLMETPKRREACDLLLDTQGNTLSKVLNTRGVGSLFLRNLQMVPADSANSLPFINT